MAPKVKGRAGRKLAKKDVVESIQMLGKPSSALDKRETAQALELAVMLRASMVKHCASFVQARGEWPLMQFYSSDGTPMKVQFQVVKTVGGTKVRRGGKCGKEFLVQNAFYRYLDIEALPAQFAPFRRQCH